MIPRLVWLHIFLRSFPHGQTKNGGICLMVDYISILFIVICSQIKIKEYLNNFLDLLVTE